MKKNLVCEKVPFSQIEVSESISKAKLLLREAKAKEKEKLNNGYKYVVDKESKNFTARLVSPDQKVYEHVAHCAEIEEELIEEN